MGGVMDYSLLMGFHNLAESTTVGTGWRDGNVGIWGEGVRVLYFIGLIDFLISYGFKKRAESMVRAAQGHGEDASCVDPNTYARRQVGFVRKFVVFSKESEDKSLDDICGTDGSLIATILSAKNLMRADV